MVGSSRNRNGKISQKLKSLTKLTLHTKGRTMLFFSFFKTLVDQEIILELKNDIEIKGTLRSVDQYLNLKLDNVSTVNESKYPHLKAVKTLFIRGSTVRYVHMSASAVDCTLLQDASRRGMWIEFILYWQLAILTHQRPWSKLANNFRCADTIQVDARVQ